MKIKNTVINTITKEVITKGTPVDEEVFFDGGIMITETDTKGIITYANRKFREMSGYTKKELIGSPHSINRHPDMPKGAFRGMWKIIADKKFWRGYVKNLRKDGRFYWVLVYIQPKLDVSGKLIGYIAARKIAYTEGVSEAEQVYKDLHNDVHINNPVFFNDGYHKYTVNQKQKCSP